MPIQVESVSKSFAGSGRAVLKVLDAISLCVENNERVAIVGASGSGKSTLLNLVSGFLGPDEGRIVVDHVGIVSRRARPNLSFMYQQADKMIYPWRSVAGNIELSLKLSGAPDPNHELRDRLLAQVEIDHRKGNFPNTLSGGERRRLAFAMVLAQKKKYLLLDEPFSGLDVNLMWHMWDVLDEYRREHSVTLLMVTHNIDEAALLADRVVLMGLNKKASVLEKRSKDFGLPDHPKRSQLLDAESFVNYREYILHSFQDLNRDTK